MKVILWPAASLFLWLFASICFASVPGDDQDPAALRVNALRLKERIDKLAGFGGTVDGGVHRVAFSKEDILSRGYLMDLMKEAGLEVRIDEAGNIIGRREGKESDLPVIMAGSHSDTVPHGGRFDGSAGVLSAI